MANHEGVVPCYGRRVGQFLVDHLIWFNGKIKPFSQVWRGNGKELFLAREKVWWYSMLSNYELSQEVALAIVKYMWQMILVDGSRCTQIRFGVIFQHIPAFHTTCTRIRDHKTSSNLMWKI